MLPHIFSRLRTALAAWFALPDGPHTNDIDPNEYWRYHAGFHSMWYW